MGVLEKRMAAVAGDPPPARMNIHHLIFELMIQDIAETPPAHVLCTASSHPNQKNQRKLNCL